MLKIFVLSNAALSMTLSGLILGWGLNAQGGFFSPRAAAGPAVGQHCHTLFAAKNSLTKNAMGSEGSTNTSNKVDSFSGFNVFPGLVKGGLRTIAGMLPEIRKHSDLLLVGPLNTQGLAVMPDGQGGVTHNKVGYWPNDHSAVDPALGGEAELQNTIEGAKNLGFKHIWMDLVYAHTGYVWRDIMRYKDNTGAPYIQRLGSIIKLFEHNILIPAKEVFFNGKGESMDDLVKRGILLPVTSSDLQPKHWDRLNSITDPTSDETITIWKRFQNFQLFGLHKFNHQNPEVRSYLVGVMLDFLKKGVTGFRMDAALYVHPEATADMINQVHGSRPETRFLMELLVPREAVLHRMMVELKRLVTHSSRVFYFDFPQMYEIRRIQEQRDYHLSWLMGYLQNLNRIGMDRTKLVPTITNHDFGTAFADTGLEEIAFALSEFSSFHSNLLFPHLDRSNPHSKDNNRQVISEYQAHNDSVGNLVGVFKKALEPYRMTKEVMANPDVWTGHKWVSLNDLPKDFIENYRSAEGRYGRDSLALKMSHEGRKLFLFVKKDDLPHTFHFPLRGEGGEMKVLYQMNNPAVTLGDSIKIESNGRTIVLIEMN